MGVKGLMSFVKKKAAWRRTIVDSTSSFVFDGNAYVHWICNSYRSSFISVDRCCPLLDVDYEELQKKTIEVVQLLRRSGASIAFIFDSIVMVDKLATKVSRLREQIDKLDYLKSTYDADCDDARILRLHSVPVLGLSCVYETLLELGVEVIFAEDEADIELARVSIQRNALIVSCDSDMLVFHTEGDHHQGGGHVCPRGLVVLDDDAFGYDSSRDELFVWVINARFVAALLGVPQHRLCRVAAFAGYDYSDAAVLSRMQAYLATTLIGSEPKRVRMASSSSNKKRKQRQRGRGGEKAAAKQVGEGNTLFPGQPPEQKQPERDLWDTVCRAVQQANSSRAAIRGYPNKQTQRKHVTTSAVEMLLRAAGFVKEGALRGESLRDAVAELEALDPCPPGLGEELSRCARYYCLGVLDEPSGPVASEKPDPYGAPLRQATETGMWFEPVYTFLGADEEAMKEISTLLAGIRRCVYGQLHTSFDRILEVSGQDGVLHVHNVAVDAAARTEESPLTPLFSKKCAEGGVEGGGGGLSVWSHDALRSCAAELLAALLSFLGHDDPQHTAENFHAMLSRAPFTRIHDDTKWDVTLVDRWMAVQLSVWYTNLAAAATAPGDAARLSAQSLRRV